MSDDGFLVKAETCCLTYIKSLQKSCDWLVPSLSLARMYTLYFTRANGFQLYLNGTRSFSVGLQLPLDL